MYPQPSKVEKLEEELKAAIAILTPDFIDRTRNTIGLEYIERLKLDLRLLHRIEQLERTELDYHPDFHQASSVGIVLIAE